MENELKSVRVSHGESVTEGGLLPLALMARWRCKEEGVVE